MEESHVARISLKLKTGLSLPIENSEAPNLKSVPDSQNIKNPDTEKQLLQMEEKSINRKSQTKENVQDNADEKEIAHSPVMKKIENQEKIKEDFAQKDIPEQVIKEETPQSPAENREKIHQIK